MLALFIVIRGILVDILRVCLARVLQMVGEGRKG